MANENLKSALKNAGMTPEEFASIIQVDPKSVQRWIAGTTTPYPRHRAKISRALDIAEHELWPDTAPRSGAGDRWCRSTGVRHGRGTRSLGARQR